MLVQQAGVQHTELQLRCSFRWVLVVAYMEPARGYLGRALRARLLQHEVETRQHCAAAHQITHCFPPCALVNLVVYILLFDIIQFANNFLFH